MRKEKERSWERKIAACILALAVVLVAILGTLIVSDGVKGSEEKYINVNGVRLAYIEEGKGRPLLLLHGGGGDHHEFNSMVKKLSKTYRVFAIDSRGHGNSSAVKEYNYQDMADDINAFIKEKGLKKPALYGFSDGGITGLLLASQHPKLLSAMIISGANTNPQGLRPEGRKAMEEEYKAFGDALLRMELTQPHITEAELKKIKIPVLVLAGSSDLVKESHTRLLAAAIPGSELNILEGEDHSSYVLEKEKAAELIEGFLEKQRTASRREIPENDG